MTRRRLSQRRAAIAVELEHAGHHFRMQVGSFPDGALGEVFLDAIKQNSMLDAFAADAAILLSLLLQHGVTPAESGEFDRRGGRPARRGAYPMTTGAIFTLTLRIRGKAGQEGIHALRVVLKRLLRDHGFICLHAQEECDAGNTAATEEETKS
jgi:hypothetical protein